MIPACELFNLYAGCGIRIASRGSARVRPSRGSSAIPHGHHHAHPAVKKAACGTYGRVRRGWYDRKPRRVRDLACGDLRIYLDVEVRLVASALWRGEAGAPRVSRGQSLLIVHFQHLLFHSLRLPMVAAKAGVPSLLTLHDFWLLCPQINLLDHRQRISWPIDRRNCIALLRDEIQRKYSWRRLCGWEPTLLTGKVRIPTHPDRLFRSILIAHSV